MNFMRGKVAASVCLCLLLATGRSQAADPAEGFGALARGGEGGQVIAVTSLADGGEGTLRKALGESGPRIIRFNVEGAIQLKSRLRCTDGRVTIDGATAPGGGITLQDHGLQ